MKKILFYLVLVLGFSACQKEDEEEIGLGGEIIGQWESTSFGYEFNWGNIDEVTGERSQDSIQSTSNDYEHYNENCIENEFSPSGYSPCWQKTHYIFEFDQDFKIINEIFLDEAMTELYSQTTTSQGTYQRSQDNLIFSGVSSFLDEDDAEITLLTDSKLEYKIESDEEYSESVLVLDSYGNPIFDYLDVNGQPVYQETVKQFYVTRKYEYKFTKLEN